MGRAVQSFVNRAMLERAAAGAFAGPRARWIILAILSFGVLAASGLVLSLIWLSAVLLIEEIKERLLARAPVDENDMTRLVLDITSASALAAAPAIVWYASNQLGEAVAVGMLALLLVSAGFGATQGRFHALLACAPYAFVGGVFALEASAAGALLALIACLISVGFVAGAALYHTHRLSDARAQDAEWLRQCNMLESDSAAWELDFARQRIVSGERLAHMLGREISYHELVDTACYAHDQDRALAASAFAPSSGPPRRIALEHEAIGGDGGLVRLQHFGYLRCAPDGAPLRLTCVTKLGDAVSGGVSAETHAVFSSQNRTLSLLASEISDGFDANELMPAHPAAALEAIRRRADAITQGVEMLAEARRSAETANLAKSQFLASMSHELRTPLNAIIGYTEMLAEDAQDRDDASTARDLDRILASATNLLSLLNEVLDFSKIEAGRMEAAPAPFSVNELLHELVDSMRPLSEQNGNAMHIVAQSSNVIADTDSMKVRQCVTNLISNACKFTQDGTIEISLEKRAFNGVDHFIISVADSGIGIPPETMARLFQPFVQADASIAQRYGGSGLGLTITRRLAQLLGGEVEAVSEPGNGATFTLRFPVDFADAPLVLAGAASIDDLQGAAEAPLIVVIEDEADARELAARALTRAGFSVQGAGGGEAGIALARAKAPALILLDIFLPDRTGWGVLQTLKSEPATRDIPVVVLSVNEDRAQALSLGAAEHLTKPADRDVLAATALRLARKRPALEAAVAAAPIRQLG